MRINRGLLLGGLISCVLAGVAPRVFTPKAVWADSDRAFLSGTVKFASGQKMGGVTVSAKAEGQTITTTVFTDEAGDYYFPELKSGKYRVWAQADGFGTGHGEVDLTTARRQDFVLKPLQDFAQQLTGDQLLASLPDDTPSDRRIKRVFRNNCTGCHQPNYVLEHRFDEQGWTAILDLMKHVNVYGTYMGEEDAPQPIIEYHEKELAAYLARVRGPKPTAMKFKLRPRPSGDPARVVFTEYDVPVDPQGGFSTKYITTDGSDWSLGTPSATNGGNGVHDAQQDFNGNLWFTSPGPSRDITIGRIDAKTGEVQTFKVDGVHGLAAGSHGMTRDQEGRLWFNVGPAADGGPGRLGTVDPSAEKIDVYTPPRNMNGTAGTLDVDGKDKVWVTTNVGVLRFDPKTHEFTEFKSPTFVNSDGVGTTYGLAADREGNAWWVEMSIDLVAGSDIRTGQSFDIKLPPVPGQKELLTPGERKMYDLTGSEWNSAVPWAQGPRRLGADKNGDFIWVCDWWGGSLAKIDIHTRKAAMIPLPRPDDQQPYHAVVDKDHNVWINMMNADEVMKFDPKTSQWTEYPLPTLGAETRYVSMLDRNGSMQLILPYSRSRKVAVMSFRTQEELQSLKNQVQQQERAQARLQ
jgi:streptogramin lyase